MNNWGGLMRKRVLFSGAFLFTLASCGVNSSSSPVKVIVGPKAEATFSERAAQDLLGSRVAAIGLTSGRCTAFHLGGGLVATAGHCLPPSVEKGAHRPCLDTTISWGQSPSGDALSRSQCLEVLAQTFTDAEDYALLRVDPYPQVSFAGSTARDFAESYFVVGYPEGHPLSVSKSCFLTWRSDLQINHTCDTLPGNSGSPILSRDLEVIAIHNGGKSHENFGTLLAPVLGTSREAEAHWQAGDLSYGPMADNQSELLLSLTSAQGAFVSLSLDFDVEEGYDQLQYVDGTGFVRTLTGVGKVRLNHLKTPVLIGFESDYAGASQRIAIKDIKFGDTAF